MRSTAKVLKDGRVTVPHPVRERLGLEYGDYVEIDVHPVETSGGTDD